MGVHLHPTYVLANRKEIEAEIERLIGLLDAADAPSEDLEPEHDYCQAGDDGCGRTRSVAGGLAWGSPDEEGGFAVPRYGLDQSLGPVNVREAGMEHYAREMGLVRTPTGWRQA